MEAHKHSGAKQPKLYDYFRSSASYRVRIALNLKGVGYAHQSVNLREGHQTDTSFRVVNPQGLVPALEIDGKILSQSLAIIDYLEHIYPTPALLPADALQRARVLEFAYIIACDIHPINNLRVLNYLSNVLRNPEDEKQQWYKHWVREGFEAYEAKLKINSRRKGVSFGDSISLADICLIPQVYNALRFEINMSEFPGIVEVYESCMTNPAFHEARPEAHPDAC